MPTEKNKTCSCTNPEYFPVIRAVMDRHFGFGQLPIEKLFILQGLFIRQLIRANSALNQSHLVTVVPGINPHTPEWYLQDLERVQYPLLSHNCPVGSP